MTAQFQVPRELEALRRRPRTTSWVISTLAIGAYLVISPPRALRADADYYTQISERFDSWLSFTDYRDPIRGYAYPWLLRIARDAAGTVSDAPDAAGHLISLVAVPLLLCVVVPTLARRVSSAAQVNVARILLLNVLFLLAWHNDLLRPLSDIPALFLMATGALLVLRRRSLLAAAGAGLAFGLAFNIRPAYLLAVVVAVALLFLVERETTWLLRRGAVLVVCIAIALLPQVASNHENFDSLSPTPVDSGELTRLQLTEGLALDRYDTYVGKRPGQPPWMRYPNRALETELVNEFESGPAASRVFESIPDYLAFVVAHPGDASASYVRHLLNGLDVRFGGTYVESIEDANLWWPLLNYSVIVLAAGSLVVRFLRRRSITWRSPTTWFTAVLLASCVPGVVGAVETRFLMPLHLTLLTAFALCLSRADLPAQPRTRLVAAVGAVAAVLAAFAFSAGTLGSLEPHPMSVDGRVVVATTTTTTVPAPPGQERGRGRPRQDRPNRQGDAPADDGNQGSSDGTGDGGDGAADQPGDGGGPPPGN